jgi:hypothetical protein
MGSDTSEVHPVIELPVTTDSDVVLSNACQQESHI